MEYAPTAYQQQQPEFSQPDSSLVVPVFQKGDDPIDAINHMMSFLTAVGRQTTYAAGTTENTPGAGLWFSELNSAKIALMANLSRNGSDALTEVLNPDNLTYDLFNQSEQIMTSSEQSNDVSQSETEITSDSNIIPYSQYLSEAQQETVQNSNSSAQQDVMILSINVKDLKEMQNLKHFSGSNEQYAEIVRLKQNLFEQVQEKDSLMKTVSDLKNDLKMEENRNIDREIALEKKIKQLDNIIFKRVEYPKELPESNMVNTSLKELKRYLTGFDQVVKERTTATAITEGTWGFEHTKACFRDEVIPFIKELKDIFNNFNQYLVEELADVQKVFYQMEQAVEQHRLESPPPPIFEVKIECKFE
ncbi:hypothetical protein Tco_0655733 [Tanacetum coccineum]|uniref:Uncharacterized protein n=1 Tax=Tanacetum coccineum TaxID=301880 RepID=A0ABQ4X6T4_9ASTR